MTRSGPFFLFLAIALTVVGGLHYYAWIRLVRDPQLPPALSRTLTAVLVLLVVNLFTTLFLSRVFQAEAIRPLYFLAFFWMGAGFILIALVGVTDLGRLVGFLAGKLSQLASGGAGTAADADRRVFLSRAVAGGVGVVASGLAAFGVKSAMGDIAVKPVAVNLPRLPEGLRGLKVVQISDVHIGPLLRKAWLDRVVDRIQTLKPDVIVITGDLVDGSVAELSEHVAPLARLSAPRGVFFVTGNHDFYSGARPWLAHLKTLGIKPLENERVKLADGLEIAGIHDLSGRNFGPPLAPDLDRALAGRDPKGAVILLAHQPKQFHEAAAKGVELTLSGHTHAGQFWPATWLVHLAQEFVAGLHKKGDSQLYVSKGTGFWGPPLRVGAPAEITLIELSPAAA